LALDQKLTAVLHGQAQPQDATEELALADLCQHHKQQYVAAAKFYGAAFKAAPPLAEDLTKSPRYNAACTAALAAEGKGKDAGHLPAVEKAKWRQQALTWLKADLALWQRQATSKNPVEVQAVSKQLSHWQADPDLASLRDAKALNQLPEAERQAWQALWAEVDQLLHKVKQS
jgi:hypothetical protein